jgi:hypothetical protein
VAFNGGSCLRMVPERSLRTKSTGSANWKSSPHQSDGSAEHGQAMPSVKRRASKILQEYGEAQSELIGKAVVFTDGEAGTVENFWLDELHGLRISIKRP